MRRIDERLFTEDSVSRLACDLYLAMTTGGQTAAALRPKKPRRGLANASERVLPSCHRKAESCVKRKHQVRVATCLDL